MSVNRFLVFSDPDMQKALVTIMKTGKIVRHMREEALKFGEKVAALGFPSVGGGFAEAPFDEIRVAKKHE